MLAMFARSYFGFYLQSKQNAALNACSLTLAKKIAHDDGIQYQSEWRKQEPEANPVKPCEL